MPEIESTSAQIERRFKKPDRKLACCADLSTLRLQRHLRGCAVIRSSERTFNDLPRARVGRLPMWTIPMCFVWAATRDIEAVAHVELNDPASTHWLFADDDLPFWYGAHVLAWRSWLLVRAGAAPLPDIGVAFLQLQEHAARGTIVVRGLMYDQGKANAIPADAWANLQIMTLKTVPGFVAGPADLQPSADWWSRLMVLPDELLKIWPRAEKADDAELRRQPHSGKASQEEHNKYYRAYVDECVANGRSPNVNDDETAGRRILGERYERTKWRTSRSRFAPLDEWSSTGKRKGKG
jgi:hypothetical protein